MKGLSQYLNSKADRAFKKLGIEHHTTLRNKVRHTICTVTGHPVDVATGKLFTDFVDFELPGPLPFERRDSPQDSIQRNRNVRFV
jgi:hypothetical protein